MDKEEIDKLLFERVAGHPTTVEDVFNYKIKLGAYVWIAKKVDFFNMRAFSAGVKSFGTHTVWKGDPIYERGEPVLEGKSPMVFAPVKYVLFNRFIGTDSWKRFCLFKPTSDVEHASYDVMYWSKDDGQCTNDIMHFTEDHRQLMVDSVSHVLFQFGKASRKLEPEHFFFDEASCAEWCNNTNMHFIEDVLPDLLTTVNKMRKRCLEAKKSANCIWKL